MIRRQLKSALIILAVFTVVAGIIYPVLVTGIAQLVFSNQANGSLIVSNGKTTARI